MVQSAGRLYDRWSGAFYTFLIVLAVLALNAALRKVLGSLASRALTAKHLWRAALLDALSPPLRGLVWIVGLSAAVNILTRGGEFSLLSELFHPARDVTAIGLMAWFLLRAVARVESTINAQARTRGTELDPTAADAIGKLVRAAIVITTALVIMQTLGFSISGILAFGGIGGIAIGFAAQGLVANLFGGLTVYASRPFKVGEWIIMPGNDVMGEVQQIGWRATRIMGFDRRPFYVPNAMFNTAVVINHSRMTNRRIMEALHLRYRDLDKVEAIVADVNRMLAEHDGIEHDFFVFRFDSYSDFALKLLLYAFTVGTDYTDYMQVKEDILLKIAAIVRKHGAELAGPASTIQVPDGLPLRGEPRRLADEPFAAGLIEHPQRG